ncbi:hypothetical protein FB479_11425 [Brevibacillus sp. AG162]|nr:hypothetical protein FB479_11425 [Brevibacillus sp. AG162]
MQLKAEESGFFNASEQERESRGMQQKDGSEPNSNSTVSTKYKKFFHVYLLDLRLLLGIKPSIWQEGLRTHAVLFISLAPVLVLIVDPIFNMIVILPSIFHVIHTRLTIKRF